MAILTRRTTSGSTSSSNGNSILDRAGFAQAVLDCVQSNIFVADLELRIMYMNQAAGRTVRGIASDVRAAFGLEVGEILGGSIHRFHKDPARIERILHDPSKFPHKASFTFSSTTLTTTINGINDAQGNHIGYVVNWTDSSQQKALNELMAAVSSDMLTASEELSRLSGEFGAAATQTSSASDSVAAAAEEMTSSVTEISRNTSTAAHAATVASTAVADTKGKMSQLEESSREIGEVVKLIRAIAGQTNLLALNATIEAARAGDAGKGFAVVAAEVKELSQETATATARIAEMVESIQRHTAEATEAINTVTTVVGTISEQQISISGALEEQTATSQEISRGIANVASSALATASGVDQLRHATSGLTERAEKLVQFINESKD